MSAIGWQDNDTQIMLSGARERQTNKKNDSDALLPTVFDVFKKLALC